MPEFNRNFSQGKMNKDLDERIVPVGQYRDAMNVEVSTSEGSDVGALQTLHGNIPVTPGVVPTGSHCVGSIINNEENCIYWLIAGGEEQIVQNHFVTKDYILKYNVDDGSTTYVFVDIYKVRTKISSVVEGNENYITTTNPQGLRPGMVAETGAGNLMVERLSSNVGGNTIYIDQSYDTNSIAAGDDIEFRSRRVLDFSKYNDITGINIVDDFIMFTDDISEPKLINIKRSIMGTGGANGNAVDWFGIGEGQDAVTHTRLVSDRRDGLFQDDGLEIVNNPDYPDVNPAFSELENNTTIKKSPLTPPTLLMSASLDGDTQGGFFANTTYNGFVSGNPPTTASTGSTAQLVFDSPMDLDINDFVVLTNDLTVNPQSFTNFDVRLQVMEVLSPTEFLFTIVSIREEMSSDQEFYALKQQVDPLFEFKFPRFAYRYKYVDGQYSSFSPFSEVAFLPGPFSMDPKEGYNLGMANRLRNLKVQNYAPHPTNRPKDIVEIDILYKEDKSTTVYTVKTLRRQDGIGTLLWPEDEGGLTDYIDDVNIGIRGSINITSELIHAVVPENQLLRPWDNVPRLAKAQEVSGNRLIYANYLQNYDLLDIHNTLITPTASLVSQSTPYDVSQTRVESPLKSTKTMRTYQLGVVYRDEMGRETPVLADKERGSLYLGKEFCDQQTSLITKIGNNAPNWATSFKFFIKETADEYYNLALDRWYNAEDGNIWLSFASSDRNKIDIETFLELKKAHDRSTAVTEPARYKVLAIENEAPKDIKLDRKTQGLLENGADGGTANNMIGNSVSGFPLDGGMDIQVRRSEFEEVYDADFIVSKASEMSLKIRNLGGERSEWYSISRVELDDTFGSADDAYKIVVEKAFGDDVGFCSDDGTWAGRTSGILIEITHDEYEDKPEFDGKFFVKVFKDKVLEDNVLITDEENLAVINAYPLGYLHTYKLATGGTQNVAHTKNDAGGVMLNVLDKYYEGIAGNGIPNTESGGPGNGTCHEHPFGYSNANGNPYRWGDNAAAGAGNITHPWLSGKNTTMPWSTVSDPSEENGAYDSSLDDAANQASDEQYSNASDDGGGFFSDLWDSVTEFLGSLLDTVLGFYGSWAGDNGHRGIGKWQWGQDFWKELTTRSDGTHGRPYVFIDDAWALSWCITDEMIHDAYKNADWNDQEGSGQKQRIRAMLKLNSAPWVGDYGTGWQDVDWNNNFITLPNGETISGGDLLLAPWTGRSTVNAAPFVDVGKNYFAVIQGGTASAPFTFAPDTQQALRRPWPLFNYSEGYNAPSWAQNGSAGVRGNLIDISVVGGMRGMDAGCFMGDDSGQSPSNVKFMTGTGSGNVDKEIEFFTQLFIEGVRWRFRQDPDKTLYRTQGHHEHYGIVNMQASDSSHLAGDRNQYFHSYNKRNKFTISVDKNFGSGPSGWIPTANMAHDGSEAVVVEIMGPYGTENGLPSDNPAVFETHPKEAVDVDIYYEISRAYPVRISKDDDETLTFLNSNIESIVSVDGTVTPTPGLGIVGYEFSSVAGTNSAVKLQVNLDVVALGVNVINGDIIRVRDSWGGAVDLSVAANYTIGSFELLIDPNVHNKRIELPWHNCYVFGNGVESNRIRDDFNQPTIQNGVKASTTLAEQYKEERRKEGLIFSGIYNSRSGVNRLNQFIQAEPITKDLNPDNGSIQKLFTRDTDIVTFCEDKVLKILSQKDALFNADGNTNVTATSKVLGAAVPFQGDFGISKNPESFAADQYRCYFTDVQRGSVLRLSKDGLTPISDYGMKDWFTDKLYSLDVPRIIGSFDSRKNNYNLTISNKGGAAKVVPYQNVNPGEMVFTGLSSGHYQNGLGHVNHVEEDPEPEQPHGDGPVISDPPPPPPPPPPVDTSECQPHPLSGLGPDVPFHNGTGYNQAFDQVGWDENGEYYLWIHCGGTLYKADGTKYNVSGPNSNCASYGTPPNFSGYWAQNFNPSSFETPNGVNTFEGDETGVGMWDGVTNCVVPLVAAAGPIGGLNPNTQWSNDCDESWMPPEGPDALPNVDGFPECGWPINGQVVIGNTTYSVGGSASVLGSNGQYTHHGWASVLNPVTQVNVAPLAVLNMDHFQQHGTWAYNMQNN